MLLLDIGRRGRRQHSHALVVVEEPTEALLEQLHWLPNRARPRAASPRALVLVLDGLHSVSRLSHGARILEQLFVLWIHLATLERHVLQAQ
eukprot:4076558-Prymnesium_polylepis.1